MRKWGSWEILYNLPAASRMGIRRLLYLMTPCVLGRKAKGEMWHQTSSSISSIRTVMHVCMYLVALVVSDSVTPWTVARQAPWPMGFSRQKYCSGLPCSPPGDLSDPWIEPVYPALQANSLPLSHWGKHDAHPGQLKGRPGTLSHVQLLYFL